MANAIYILAEASGKSRYNPYELGTDIDQLLERLEYGDVVEKRYQIWEYPTGKISAIEADRVLDGKDYYSTPYGAEGLVWSPRLVPLETNTEKVSSAYEHLVTH